MLLLASSWRACLTPDPVCGIKKPAEVACAQENLVSLLKDLLEGGKGHVSRSHAPVAAAKAGLVSAIKVTTI